ncbi:MAG: hypothetical protein Q4B58_05165 [Bacteroidales bacterium]|nr:hypothetical protein [Bacteroidales bacterium]
MKLEAMALFAGIKAQANTARWWYFEERRRLGQPVRIDQSVSPYRASLFFDYIFSGIVCQVFIEREAHVGKLGENHWKVSVSGIEGKAHALLIENTLKPLQAEGYYLPNGNENLERQMNFSLGLYGACLMHIDVHCPMASQPLMSVLHVLDLLEQTNQRLSPPLQQVLDAQADDDEDNPDIIMGDWQTWK